MTEKGWLKYEATTNYVSTTLSACALTLYCTFARSRGPLGWGTELT